MGSSSPPLNQAVSAFLDEQNHALRREIELLREYILTADDTLTESIKWNGPSYSVNKEDRLTMKIQPPTTKHIQLIFHRGAKKQEQPAAKVINDDSNLLTWKENDRAIATFKSIADIENARSTLQDIVRKWIRATT
jgi:hypothetical protein